MKPAQKFCKISTDKLLKGKQVYINNELVQSGNGTALRSLTTSSSNLKKVSTPLSFPVESNPPLDTKLDEFIVQKPLAIDKFFSDNKEAWLDIQSYFKNRGVELEDKAQDFKPTKHAERSDKESDINTRKLFKSVENEKALVPFMENDCAKLILNIKDKACMKMFSNLSRMLGNNIFSPMRMDQHLRKGEINQLRFFMTSVPRDNMSNRDTCLPVPLPPKGLKCSIPKELVDCKLLVFPKWEGCDKICMPCCCPATEECTESQIPKLNTCKKIEYRIPSFTECKRSKLPRLCPKECCYIQYICPEISVGSCLKPLIRTKIRQSWLLGRKTNYDHLIRNRRTFSSMPVLMNNEKDCKKSTVLPCLKASEILGASKKKQSSNKVCEKLCMPCCAPARDPPDCFFPYVKPECKKLRPPRPSYSECKKDIMASPKPCECLIPRPPLCDKMAKDKGEKGCGKS